MSAKARLLDAIDRKLVPALRDYGFEGPFREEVALTRRLDKKALLLHFRKLAPSAPIQVLDINIKSFSCPTFTIYGGSVPAGGVRMLYCEELLPPEKVTAGMLEERTYLQSSPCQHYSPFRVSLLAYWAGSKNAIDRVVEQARSLLPFLLRWIENRSPSPHLMCVVNRPPRKGCV